MTILVETAFPQSSVPGNFRVELLGRHGRCLAGLRLCKSIRSVLDKFQNTPRTALDQSPMQSCEALLVGRVDAGAPAQEQVDALGKALVGSPHQRGVAESVEDIDGNSLVQEKNDQEGVAIECRDVERVVTLGVGDERVGAVLEKKVDGIVVTSLSRPLKRCRY